MFIGEARTVLSPEGPTPSHPDEDTIARGISDRIATTQPGRQLLVEMSPTPRA